MSWAANAPLWAVAAAVGARTYCGGMSDGGGTTSDAAALRLLGRRCAATAVRLLERDADTGDATTQAAVEDAVEAISQRLTALADVLTAAGAGARP